jgi:hypothetical protein
MESTKEVGSSSVSEVKHSKYKSMMNGIVMKETILTSNVNNLDAFLEKEKNSNQGEQPWSKLDKTAKIKKIVLFAEKYKEENNITQIESDALLVFLKDCLDRKRLARVKDVIYDKVSGEIKEIPALHFNKNSNHFTLKNIDKQRTSTLKSLPPKKIRATAKNLVTTEEDDDDDVEEKE